VPCVSALTLSVACAESCLATMHDKAITLCFACKSLTYDSWAALSSWFQPGEALAATHSQQVGARRAAFLAEGCLAAPHTKRRLRFACKNGWRRGAR